MSLCRARESLGVGDGGRVSRRCKVKCEHEEEMNLLVYGCTQLK